MKDEDTIYFNKPLRENNEFYTSDVKRYAKLGSLFLMLMIISGWLMVILMLSSQKTFLWGCLFGAIIAGLTYITVKKIINDMKLKKGDLYFKVSPAGIEYTSINEISGGVTQRILRWSDVVTSPVRDCESDIHFLNNGYKNNTKNMVFYVSHQAGVTEKVLIPLHHIKRFKNYWEISRAIIMNVASLQYPTLTIDETVFYNLNLNPRTFTFSRKSIRRILSDIFCTVMIIIVGLSFVAGAFGLGKLLDIDFSYLIFPSLIGGVIVAIVVSMTLSQRISFLKNSYPKFTRVAYRDNSTLSIEEGGS